MQKIYEAKFRRSVKVRISKISVIRDKNTNKNIGINLNLS